MIPMKLNLTRYDRIAIKTTIIVVAFVLVTVAFFASVPAVVSKWIAAVVAGIQIGRWIFDLAKWVMEKDYD